VQLTETKFSGIAEDSFTKKNISGSSCILRYSRNINWSSDNPHKQYGEHCLRAVNDGVEWMENREYLLKTEHKIKILEFVLGKLNALVSTSCKGVYIFPYPTVTLF
jgi:hypothetical protein